MPSFRQLIAVAAGLSAAAFAAPAAAAGFWETLFGIPPRPAVAPRPESGPLHMTVRPKRKKVVGTGQDGPKTLLAKPMEYADDPFWYLKDETLKKGDVIVLKDRVVVFDGGARAYANFASFQTSPLLSARAKSQLRYLVSAPKDNSTVWQPAKPAGEPGAASTAKLPERIN
ncbi:hypothetical protein [Bosea sp. CS1GBMeth4]|uniref:hypothetical protein n=1 Tax=Bosea sp. CS1GBMeth4 TaxID=1892849 RepID=UPI00164741BC|nr:hypothetical protein [Bosea sp. CS1GBMeth4]